MLWHHWHSLPLTSGNRVYKYVEFVVAADSVAADGYIYIYNYGVIPSFEKNDAVVGLRK